MLKILLCCAKVNYSWSKTPLKSLKIVLKPSADYFWSCFRAKRPHSGRGSRDQEGSAHEKSTLNTGPLPALFMNLIRAPATIYFFPFSYDLSAYRAYRLCLFRHDSVCIYSLWTVQSYIQLHTSRRMSNLCWLQLKVEMQKVVLRP